VSLLASVLLTMSLFLAVDHAALIEKGLNGQVLPKMGPGNVDASRPIGMCLPNSSVSKQHHGGGNCPFNFALSLSQENLIQVRGTSSRVQLSVTLVSGISAPVTLSAQGVPAGTEILFAPASGKPSFLSTMTIATGDGTPLGQFNITILVAGGGLEESSSMPLLVVPMVHNISIVSASVQGTATVGSVVLINATVANYGSVSEAFELQAYTNATLAADRFVPKLAPEAIYTSQLMWNTTGFSTGTYSVLVTIHPSPGELNLFDNSREAGKIVLTQTPGSRPSPSPAASGGTQGFNYGRQLAIAAAIAEAGLVFLIVLRRREKSSVKGSTGPGKI